MNTTSANVNRTNRFCPINMTSRHIVIVACILVIVGYILMSGSGSTEHAFNPAIFSTRRTVIAPLSCLTGYLLIIVGVLRKK